MTELQRKRRKMRKQLLRLQRMVLGGLILCAFLLPPILLLSRCGKREAKKPELLPAESDILPDLPGLWQRQQAAAEDLARGTLLLVNPKEDYDPELPQTVSIYDHKTESYVVRDRDVCVREDVMDALNAWMDAFAAQSGKTTINIVAGWRSYDDQAALYRNAVENKGQAHADAYFALPGHSEHHTGLAVDLDTYNSEDGSSGDFDGGGEYRWAVEHAWEYGFVQRYPPEKTDVTGISFEAWHFRYVGLPHACVMAAENLCLEEYLDKLREYPFSGEHLHVKCRGSEYELYFCPKEQLVVPTGGSYTISGNNVDGFIVAVKQG